ncbi:hypothetical protein PL263_09210 [Methylomonas sp. EFPC3]|uniref:hypothetical protein n=1 Tax=Methylomonas sp. EFPC3 TaxID=3021710 RepID=UPI002416F3A2|nr:hypothetical protein [Methylomonas sp. EFPC3]WFP52189.1 hypothetical protein PL263_09210 [Methylomonas sp. EFPC3]
MDAYLPMIQSILLDWYQLTLANPEYAGAVAVAVWLLTSIFYSIRIYFLKKANATLVKLRLGLQSDLETAQQQLQSSQAELAASVQQLAEVQTAAEESAQRAAGLEEKVVAGNRQLIDSIKALANKFELTEPSLPAANNADSGDLWSRYAAISEQAVERFQTEQKGKTDLQLSLWAETAKLAEKDALLEPLQRKVEEQTAQVAKLELALEEQKIRFERQQANAEKALAETVSRYQTEVGQRDNPVNQPAPAAVAPQPIVAPIPESTPAVIQPQIAAVSAPEVAAPVEPIPMPEPTSAPVVTAAPAPVTPAETAATVAPSKQASVDKAVEKSGGFGKFKQLLNNTMQQMAKLDQKLGTQTTVEVAESVEEAAVPAAEPVAEPVPEQPVVVAEPVVEVAAPAPAKASKLKSLFGKSKPAEEPQPAPVAAPEPPPAPAPAPIPAAAKQDKLKDLFSKWK